MRVDVLGPVRVLADDGTSLALGGPRPRAVLTVLALLAGTTVPVDRLADAVWDGRPPRTAEHTLHNYVLRLRRLGVAITTDGNGYRLDTPTDASELEALLDEAGATSDRTAVLAATSLVRGRPGCDLPDGELTRARCATLDELVEVLAEEAAAALLDDASDASTTARVVPRLRALADEAPYRERRWELLILGLYRSGRQADALDAFSGVRAILRRELGVDPGPTLRRLQQLVLSQDPSLDPRADPAGARHLSVGGRALPGLATRLIGRVEEIAELQHAQERSRLVTLVGPLGAGKTRLALHAARRGPAWFVSLEGLPAPTSVARAALAVVSPASAAGDPLDGLVDALARSSDLLAIDAAESRVPEVRELVGRLLSECPDLRILVTSRQLLGSHDEATVRIGALSARDRRALLVDRARLADPSFDLAATDEADADRLCSLVDGLPLGIELVARHLRLLSVSDLTGRVDADLDRWTSGSGGADTGLVGAVAIAVNQLDPERRMLLVRLAVLTAEADLELARAVGAPERDEEWLFDALAGLVDSSLVQVRSGPGGLRYGLLLSVRRYCLGLLAEQDRADAEGAYVDAVLQRSARTAAALQSPRRAELLLALDIDAPHLRAALAASLDGGDATRAALVAASLTDYWLARQLGEGMAWLQRLLAVSDLGGVERAGVLLQMGHLAYWLTDFDLGVRLLQEARSLLPAGEDPLLLGRVLRRLGAIAAARDDLLAADELLRASAEVLTAAGDPAEEAVSLLHLGSLLADQNRSHDALPLLMRASDALAAAHDPLREAQAYSALTLAWWKAGDLDAARGAGERALRMFRELGHRPTEGVVAYRLAAICRAGGDVEQARELAQSALRLGCETGTRTTTALAHDNLARLDLDAGVVPAAADHVVAALDLIDVAADRWVLADLLETAARLQHSWGRPVLPLLQHARVLRAAIGQPSAPTDARELDELASLVLRGGEPAVDAESESPPEPAELRAYARALATWSGGPVGRRAPAAPA